MKKINHIINKYNYSINIHGSEYIIQFFLTEAHLSFLIWACVVMPFALDSKISIYGFIFPLVLWIIVTIGYYTEYHKRALYFSSENSRPQDIYGRNFLLFVRVADNIVFGLLCGIISIINSWNVITFFIIIVLTVIIILTIIFRHFRRKGI